MLLLIALCNSSLKNKYSYILYLNESKLYGKEVENMHLKVI